MPRSPRARPVSPSPGQPRSVTPVMMPTPMASDDMRTWGKLVGETVAGTVSKEERSRQESIFELLATEEDFVHDATIVLHVFYWPLMKEKLVARDAVKSVFSNWDQIVEFATAFQGVLRKEYSKQNNKIDMIGDVLCANVR